MPCSGELHQLTTSIVVGGLDIDDVPQNPFSAYDEEPPPAPKLQSKGIIAMDITQQFISAAKRMHFSSSSHVVSRADAVLPGLDIGQLVKPQGFSLFEAVGALEVH